MLIKKDTEPKIYYVITTKDSDGNLKYYLPNYSDYIGWWTSNISEAAHYYPCDAICKANNLTDSVPMKVTEDVLGYNLSKVTFDDIRDWLFIDFSNACMTHDMRNNDTLTKNPKTGVPYPKEWADAFVEIKEFIEDKFNSLEKVTNEKVYGEKLFQ